MNIIKHLSLPLVSCFVGNLEVIPVEGFFRVKSSEWNITPDRRIEPWHGHIQTQFLGLSLVTMKKELGSRPLTQRVIYRLLHFKIKPINNEIKTQPLRKDRTKYALCL
jgi:hypothetical protein